MKSRTEQRFSQATEHPDLFLRRGVDALVSRRIYEPLAESDGALREDFEYRASGQFEKPGKVISGTARAALSDVGGDGYRCPAHLVGEPEAFIRGELPGFRVDQVSEVDGLVPDLELFKVLHNRPILPEEFQNFQLTTFNLSAADFQLP